MENKSDKIHSLEEVREHFMVIKAGTFKVYDEDGNRLDTPRELEDPKTILERKVNFTRAIAEVDEAIKERDKES